MAPRAEECRLPAADAVNACPCCGRAALLKDAGGEGLVGLSGTLPVEEAAEPDFSAAAAPGVWALAGWRIAQPIAAIAARNESFSMAHFLSGHEKPPVLHDGGIPSWQIEGRNDQPIPNRVWLAVIE
jgi:hypothetical protein